MRLARHAHSTSRTRRFLLIALIVALALCMAASNKPEPIRVLITPKIGLAPLRVTVRVSVYQGVDPNFTCPKVTIIWPNGSDGVESDCDPDDPTFDPVVRSWKFYSSGEVEVLVKQGTAERTFKQPIEVMGGN